jgi:hypothetical protein
MQKTIAKESPRRVGRRFGAAGVALAAVLTLGACRATGGGYIDEPLPGGPVNVFQGQANFGFNFTCDVETAKKRAVIRGTITYHDDPSTLFPDGIKINGDVDPFFIEGITTCAEADVLAGVEGVPVAQFDGDYRSQDTTIPVPTEPGRFSVTVFDQGEPGSPATFDGDQFSIVLTNPDDPDDPYAGYTRAGYIEGGNIQVED